ncbi:MAG: tRNA preQ1(34) S-adenosylmethionine ribosyltransferase-isomerase QueA [Bacillota bacterium]
MKVSDFDFSLPQELIAQHPLQQRDASRLLVLNKASCSFSDNSFTSIVDYLRPGDLMVVNNTRVIPARLLGVKKDTGAKIEIVLLTQRQDDCWEVLAKPGKRLKIGSEISFGNGQLEAVVVGNTEVGGKIIKFRYQGIFNEILDELGQMPLPPYITAQLEDQERYQTVYAKDRGSAAAPTAGLHFTPDLLQRIRDKGVEIIEILLHVGIGTFRPVKAENITDHQMHGEYYKVSQEAAAKINQALEEHRRIIAVGTTSCRTLESVYRDGKVIAGDGWTDIFIYPGYQFKVVSGLLTNFHLPKSTLLMLVSALAGRENILKAYEHAVSNKYRFFSFGDAMLII